MPDKIVAVYALRRMYSSKATVVDGVTIKNWIDIVVGDYGRDPSQVPYGDLTSKECSGQSMEFVRGTGGDLQGQRLIKPRFWMVYGLFTEAGKLWQCIPASV